MGRLLQIQSSMTRCALQVLQLQGGGLDRVPFLWFLLGCWFDCLIRRAFRLLFCIKAIF